MSCLVFLPSSFERHSENIHILISVLSKNKSLGVLIIGDLFELNYFRKRTVFFFFLGKYTIMQLSMYLVGKRVNPLLPHNSDLTQRHDHNPTKMLTGIRRCGLAAREVSRGGEKKSKPHVRRESLTEQCQINVCGK